MRERPDPTQAATSDQTRVARDGFGDRDLRASGIVRQFRVLVGLPPRRVASLLSEAYNEWSTVGAPRLGAALSYYTLFSVAPLLVVIVSIAGLIFGDEAARGEIGPRLAQLVGDDSANAIQLLLTHAAGTSQGVIGTVTGMVSLFFGASFVVNELRWALNTVWKVQTVGQTKTLVGTLRDLFTARLYAFCLVVGAGLLLVMAVLVNTTVAAAGSYFSGWLPMSELGLQTINFFAALAMTTWVFALLYKVVPDAHVTWGDACVGALATALLFDAGSLLIALYVGKAAPASIYGSAGSVLALLLWVYYSAQVFLFGAELTRVFANHYGGTIVSRHRGPAGFVRGPAGWVRRTTRGEHSRATL